MAGRVAVVTGANKGLGFAIVKALCKKFEGTVYLTARDNSRGLEAVRELNNLSLRPFFHQLDVSDHESVKNFAKFIKERHGGLDVLINNAAKLEWDAVYPSYEIAKRTIDVNYKSLLTIEEYLYPLLRDAAKVVNISSSCGHLSNLTNEMWIEKLTAPNLTTETLNSFVDWYLESVKNGKFDKNDFADEGKHAEHRVAKIAVTALTFIQSKKYFSRNITINAFNPGLLTTDMAHGLVGKDPDDAAEKVMYLIFDVSPKLNGTFMWEDGKLVDWFDPYDKDGVHVCKDIW